LVDFLFFQEALERKKLWQRLSSANATGGDLRRRSLTAVDDGGFGAVPRSGASTPGCAPSATFPGPRDPRLDPELEPMDTIFVKSVQEGGPAHLAGLLKGLYLFLISLFFLFCRLQLYTRT
jgi:hypothetical protein